MNFYFGHKKWGVLSANGFVQRNSGNLCLHESNLRVFRFYGVMWGVKFFGLITKEDA